MTLFINTDFKRLQTSLTNAAEPDIDLTVGDTEAFDVRFVAAGAYVDKSSQTIALTIGVKGGRPLNGWFTLTFGGQTTDTIAYNATAEIVQDALEGLSTIGGGNVSVEGNMGGPYRVEFSDDLGLSDVGAITANASNLWPSCTIPIAVLRTGSATANELVGVSLFQSPLITATGWTAVTASPYNFTKNVALTAVDLAAMVQNKSAEILTLEIEATSSSNPTTWARKSVNIHNQIYR